MLTRWHHCIPLIQKKISVIPNGASIEEPAVLMPEEKQSVRDRFGFDNKPIAVFLASGGYAPNDEAALYICTTLARELPMISFALMGSVCNAISENTLSTLAPNVTLLGIVSDQEKKAILSVSDIALNPVMQGSGTNIKNFDYLSAGLPVVTTPVGARGIDFIDSVNGIIADIENFPAAIHTLIENTALLKKISYNARILAEQYDWRTIAAAAGERIIQFYEENA